MEKDPTVFKEEDFKKLFRLGKIADEPVFKENKNSRDKSQENWWGEEEAARQIPIKKGSATQIGSERKALPQDFKLTNLIFPKSLAPFKYLFLAVILAGVLFLPTILTELNYWYETDYRNRSFKDFDQSIIDRQVEINAVAGKATIFIPKIGVLAPLSIGLTPDYAKELIKTGLVHLQGGIRPGEPGQAIVWGKGLRTIFEFKNQMVSLTLLDQLVVGDETEFFAQGKSSKFKVTSVKYELPRIAPQNPKTDAPELTLVSDLPFAPWRKIYVTFAKVNE